MKNGFDVIGVGALTVDIFVDYPFPYIDIQQKKDLERYLAIPFGKTYSPIIIRAGGSSGNTIAYLSKLGLKCSYFTKLGDDPFSDFLINDFKRFGVHSKKIIRERGLESGKSLILSSFGKKDTSLIVFHGSADFLTKNDIKKEIDYLTSAKWIDISSFSSKESIKAIEYLIKEAYKKCNILLTPSKTMIRGFGDHVLKMLDYITAISLNEEEAKILTKKENIFDVIKFLKKKIENGIITMGSEGIISIFKGNVYKIKAYKVKEVKNTTGAGDIVAAWFLYGLVLGLDIKDILNYAASAASIHVRKDYVGARSCLPRLEDIKIFLDKVRNNPVTKIKL